MSGVRGQTTADRTEPEHADAHRRRTVALLVLLVAPFMALLDMFIVNIAAPSVETQLHATFAQVQLVISGYIVAFAVGLITGGRLGDLWGRGRMFLYGMGGFGVTSALCALAGSADQLIAVRLLQGLSAALMLPQVLSLIQVLFPPAEHARVLGLYGATLSCGSVTGQVLGGVLIKADVAGLGWRLIFLVNIPFCLAAVLVGARFLPRRQDAATRPGFDPVGVLLISLAIPLLLVPLVFGAQTGWPLWVWPTFAAALAVFALFLRWEARFPADSGSALLPLRLFGLPGFANGVPTALAFYSGNSGFYLVLAFYMQDGVRLSPVAAGLAFVPLGTAFALASLAARSLVPRFGRKALLGGTVCILLGLVYLPLGAWTGGGAGTLDRALWMEPGLVLCGMGQGLVLPSLLSLALRGVATADVGAASGGILMTSQFAGALGVAAVGAAYRSALGEHSYTQAFRAGVLALVVIALLSLVLLARLESRTRDRE
ncbi:MFS transporter [Streptomyces sp. NPDC048281]|uniref:MFS transporter n=1 Tax=Streptomyces sp. NPDC048281 TaxID=3154715 RepID=UPI00342392C6